MSKNGNSTIYTVQRSNKTLDAPTTDKHTNMVTHVDLRRTLRLKNYSICSLAAVPFQRQMFTRTAAEDFTDKHKKNGRQAALFFCVISKKSAYSFGFQFSAWIYRPIQSHTNTIADHTLWHVIVLYHRSNIQSNTKLVSIYSEKGGIKQTITMLYETDIFCVSRTYFVL